MIAGLVLQTALHGVKGLLLSAEGALFFGGMFLLFYLVRAMGAGDVKLAAALGSIVGSSSTLPVMFATALAGAALAVCFMVVSGRVVEPEVCRPIVLEVLHVGLLSGDDTVSGWCVRS